MAKQLRADLSKSFDALEGPPDPSSLGLLAGYLTREECAREIRKSLRLLQRWETLRIGPAITYVGRTPYYKIESVKAWLASQERPQVREPRQRRRRQAGEAAE